MKEIFFTFNLPIIYLISQTLTRSLLCAYAIFHDQISAIELPQIFGLGLLNDFITLCYLLPAVYVFASLFNKIFKNKYSPFFIGYFAIIVLLIFNASAEIVFWDEFGTKFNFIAVDYLIYTNEIIGTLRESLPLAEIIIVVLILAASIIFIFKKQIVATVQRTNASQQLIIAVIALVVSLFSYNFYNEKKLNVSTNRYARELTLNGPYQFFSAFFNNSLDYNEFYPVINLNQALQNVRNNIKQPNQEFISNESIDRIVRNNLSSDAKKYNVIIITVESLSYEFLGKFVNNLSITPNIDKLAGESIFFKNFYATGTRTVRGLEAITLSVPPIPGSSIIRRPANQQLFNIASEFKNQGYDVNFIFGGYSYFDNLKNYFSGNGYNITDRGDLKSNEISFSNIWGVADEDILQKSIAVAGNSYKSGTPFFSLIMTTSNHRPYTFPDGRIDLPSGAGRSAAVKYTDYAIGRFLEMAKTEPWFDDTIFVITADHCASSAGKTELPINKYHIPLIIYSPKLLKPQVIENLASQIDIAPTILGLLNFNYKTKFFGSDILKSPANRAFISTYQMLGYLKGDYLVVLEPKTKARTYEVICGEKDEVFDQNDLIDEAISFYMLANELYRQDKMKDFIFTDK